MPLAKLKNFRMSEYEIGSAPAMETLRRDIDNGLLPGGFKDPKGRYWVDMDVWRQYRKLDSAARKLLDDPEIARLIEA